jgi:hypothetical protein
MDEPPPHVERAEVLPADETAERLRRAAPAGQQPSTFSALAELARIAAESGVKAAAWGISTGVAGTRAVVERALSGEPAAAVLQELAIDLRSAAWRALGANDEPDEPAVPESVDSANATSDELRHRGEELLRRSNDVHVTEDTHPAFARILSEITPDEARMLRYLYLNGPQPSLDVRTNRPFGVGSELIAGGLNMIAEHAGCRNLDHIHPYLTNLNRLGLIDFSKEQVSNPQRYQLVEAQPAVVDAVKGAGRLARIVHRSIRLNDFGAEFCRACLPVEGAPPG